MRILIIGAGAIGSWIASRLQRAGQAVVLLARGQRLADLRRCGLVVENMVTGASALMQVPVIEQLDPADAYDLILVVMGQHQVDAVLPMLAANRAAPAVLFLGNRVAGPGALSAALGAERVLLGFPLAGAALAGPVARYADEVGPARAGVVLGELGGAGTPRLGRIAAVFEAAGFRVTVCPDMDAWLKSHAAVIVPFAAAYFAAGGDLRRLAGTRDALVLLARALREAGQVLRASGWPILPPRNRVIFALPEPLLVGLMGRLFRLKLYEYALAHGEQARPEMAHLATDFLALARTTPVETPNLEHLCAHLDPAAPPIPAGRAALPLEWRGLCAAGLILAAAGLGAVWWWRRRVHNA